MSLLTKLLPFCFLLIGVGVAAFIGFAAYTIARDIADKTSRKMEKKNVSFGKEGMKIGVKEVKNENYVDQTQSILVKAWNLSTWPAYRSRMWNKDAQEQDKGRQGSSSGASMGRPPNSRHGSTASKTQ